MTADRDPYQSPLLRSPLDVRFEKAGSQEILLVRCPLGISKSPIGLIPAVAPILSCFDGRHSVPDITARFQPYGVREELIHELIKLLDENLFLATPRFSAAESQYRVDYHARHSRPPALAGLSYSLTPGELSGTLSTYLAHGSNRIVRAPENLVCLISPHIDYRRGGECYGITYSSFSLAPHDLLILIGTSHQYSEHLFHLSAQHFETPIGALTCDAPFIHRLAALYGTDRGFADEILHGQEHSLELQAPFLAHQKCHGKIAPILVGGFHQFLVDEVYPESVERYDSFVSSLVECIRERIIQGQRICFVAGVDMAHVGRYFGEKSPLTPEFMEMIRLRDSEYLDAIRSGDKRKLFDHVATDCDARRLCGFPTMYTIMDTLARLGISYSTEIFDYRQAVDYSNDCAVTFAGVGLYSR